MRADRHVVMGTGGTALAAPGVVALLDAVTDSATVRASEAVLFERVVTGEVTQRLMALGDDAPASFAIAVAGHGVTTVVVRGTASASIQGVGELRHDPASDTSWTSTDVSEHDGITLALTGDDTPTGQWLTTGVIAAGRLVVGSMRPTRRTTAAAEPASPGDVDFGSLVRSAPRVAGTDPEPEPPTVELAVQPEPAPDTVRSTTTASYVPPSDDVRAGRLVFSDGRQLELDAPIVVGRRPPAEPIAGRPPQVVMVDDTMLSRHHATFQVVDDRLVVVDENSTNGTTLLVPGQPALRCVAGQPAQVPVGACVDLGGVLTATHEREPTPC